MPPWPTAISSFGAGVSAKTFVDALRADAPPACAPAVARPSPCRGGWSAIPAERIGASPPAPAMRGCGPRESRAGIRNAHAASSASVTAACMRSGPRPASAPGAAERRPSRTAVCASHAAASAVPVSAPGTPRHAPGETSTADGTLSSAVATAAGEAAGGRRPARRRAAVPVAAPALRSRAARPASPAAADGVSGIGSNGPNGAPPAHAASAACRWPQDRAANAAPCVRRVPGRGRPGVPGAGSST